jgi:hypothetical protein
MKTRLLFLLASFLCLPAACEGEERGDPDTLDESSGASNSGGGGGGGGGAACADACAVLAADSSCASQGLTEALCTDLCSSRTCASCLDASMTCGSDCMDACADEGSESSGGFDPMTTGIDPTDTSDPGETGTVDPTDAGGTQPDGFPCTASAECESGVCGKLDLFDDEGKCTNACGSDGDCMLGLCCTGVTPESVVDSTCVNSC